MATIKENINRTIADFNAIAEVLKANGIDTKDLPTSDYAEHINETIQAGSATITLEETEDGVTVIATNKNGETTTAVIKDGQNGFSPIITEDENNNDETYKLNIETKDDIITTPNLKGEKGEKGDKGEMYTLTDADKQDIADKLSSDIIKQLIEHNIVALKIPDGTTKISDYQFQNDSDLRRAIAPDTLEEIGSYAFENCFRLTGIEGLNKIKTIKRGAFKNCFSLTDIEFSESIEIIESSAFENCYSLQKDNVFLQNCVEVGDLAFSGVSKIKNLYLPNCKKVGTSAFGNCTNLISIDLSSVEVIGNNVFYLCANLEKIKLGTDFNCNNMVLSMSAKYSVDTLVDILNSLKDRTGETAYTLTLGIANLAKLTDEQKAIATNKNWILK